MMMGTKERVFAELTQVSCKLLRRASYPKKVQ